MYNLFFIIFLVKVIIINELVIDYQLSTIVKKKQNKCIFLVVFIPYKLYSNSLVSFVEYTINFFSIVSK